MSGASFVSVTVPLEVAQRAYEHLGTMPYAPGSWSHVLRGELSAALHDSWDREFVRRANSLPKGSGGNNDL